jgi:hypothetical protein
MTEDMLTQDILKSLLNYEPKTGVFTYKDKKRFGLVAGNISKAGYVQIWINGKTRLAHRLAWLYMVGEWPKKQIDHINVIKTDNSFCNLREADNAENNRNTKTRVNNTSGYKGVVYDKSGSCWRAKTKFNNKDISLGSFKTPQEAANAYNDYAKKTYGNFCNLN